MINIPKPYMAQRVTDKEAILKRWAEHFNSVLNRPLSINEDAIDILQQIVQCSASNRHRNKKKVKVGKDQEKAQSEKDSNSKNRGGKKTKLTIMYLYHETYRKPNEQLFSQ